MIWNASSSFSPWPKNSGAEPMPPKFPQPRMMRETSMPFPSCRRSIEGFSLRHDARGARAVPRGNSCVRAAAAARCPTPGSSALRRQRACCSSVSQCHGRARCHVHTESPDRSPRLPALAERAATTPRGLPSRRRRGDVRRPEAARGAAGSDDADRSARAHARAQIAHHGPHLMAPAAAVDPR